MSARVTWQGLDTLIEDLSNIPDTLSAQSRHAIESAAESTQKEILENYPLGATGHLRAGVSITESSAPGVFAMTVNSRAPHAHLWELGTRDRHMPSGKSVGSMHPHREQGLIAVADRYRSQMNTELMDVVRAAGFTVEGEII